MTGVISRVNPDDDLSTDSQLCNIAMFSQVYEVPRDGRNLNL